MNIITRGDFDGLVSSVLLTAVEDIKKIKFAHPKDAQDGKVIADADDIVVNIPFIKGCGLWFDHHISEEEKVPNMGSFNGRFEMAPSAARVICNHYAPKNAKKLEPFKDLLEAADKLDSATLTMKEVTDPKGWILLGLTIDPRSGLGPEFQQYFRWLVEYIKEVPIAKVMEHPEVKKRTDRVYKEQEQFKGELGKHARVEDNVIIVDFRGRKDKPVGNRFLVYAMYPKANVEMRMFDGHKGAVVVAVGHSIFNRTSNVNIGNLLKKYGGGGHKGAGTAQLEPAKAETQIAEILNTLKQNKA
jgi:hypothetical protein